MRAETALAVAIAVVLVATLPATALAGGGNLEAGAVDGEPPAWVEAQGAHSTNDALQPGNRTVSLEVQLLASGDAEWTVSTYVPLEGEDDRAAFRELGRQYVNGTVQIETDADTFRRVVDAASTASGRPMELANAQRDWAIRDGHGVLVLRFTWQAFAREVAGDRMVVDDAFRTNTGTWLPRLEDGQVLVIRPPAGIGFLETPEGKGVTEGTLRWEGPQTFGEDYFRIVYRAESNGGTDDPSNRTTTPPNGPTDTPNGPLPAGAFLVVSLLAVGAIAAYLFRRRHESAGGPAVGEDDGPGPDVPADAAAGDGSGAATKEASEATEDATVATSEGDVTAPGTSAADESEESAKPTPEEPFAGVDVEMLSDEERVLRLLEVNGGRMKQARIVKETDWSNAKVSQLLSSMDDEDAINKLRIGRENLISLPDVDLDSVEE